MFSNFLAPTALWWLLLIPCVILLYFLKLKRQEYVVSSTILWQKVIHDMRVNSPFQKLKNNLLLYVQILLLLLVIFALARPFLSQQALQGRNIILLMDVSASMKSQDENGTRIAKAKEKAISIINDLASDDRVMIVTFHSHAKIIQTFTSIKTKLINTIHRVKAFDTKTNINEALSIAKAMTEKLSSPSIFILTDGHIKDFGSMIKQSLHPKKKTMLQILVCGKSSDNVAITSFDVRKSQKNDNYQAFVQVQNFGTKSVEIILELSINGEVIEEDLRLVELGPGGVQGIVFDQLVMESGIIKAHISIEQGNDYLKTDNSSWFVISRTLKKKICLVTSGNFLLHKALSSHDSNLTEISLFEYENIVKSKKEKLKHYDLIVFDKQSPKHTIPGIGNLFFNCLPPEINITDKKSILSEYGFNVVDQNTFHPTMRFVDLRKFYLMKMMDILWPEDTTPLLEMDAGIAIGLISRKNMHHIVVGFDIFESEWPFNISFPIFIANTISWYKNINNKHNVVSGEVAKIQFWENVNQVDITTSNKEKFNEKIKTNNMRFANTNIVGVYKFDAYNKNDEKIETRNIAVNLFSSKESNIAPITTLTIQKKNIVSRNFLAINREIWFYLLLIAVVFLLLEWHLFHKRSLSLSFFKKK